MEIEEILRKTGPTLSSNIVAALVSQGLTPAAARQRISRSRQNVRRLKAFSFANREQFLYLDEQLRKTEFLENLSETLREGRTCYARALAALQSRGGAIHNPYFSIISGLPTRPAKGQILSGAVLQALERVGLVICNSTSDGDVVGLFNSPLISERRRATMIVEDIFLGAMATWLIHVGATSPNTIKIRNLDSVPEFGQFKFDIVGASYLNTMVTHGKDGVKNGFVVGDILLDSHVTLSDIEGFLSKWEILANQRRTTRFQPIFIAETFDPSALNILRRKGCMIARPTTILGEEMSSMLQQLIGIIQNAAAAVTNDPDSVFALLKRVSKVEGASLNLRGVLIELIIGHLYQLEGYQIDVRQQIKADSGEIAEIDVKANNRKEVVCVECKGKSPGTLVDANEIQDWLETPLVRIKKWLSRTNLPEKRRFEFYSSTGYTDDATELINEIQNKHKKQPISFHTGADVIQRLRDQNEASLIEIFREHFSTK